MLGLQKKSHGQKEKEQQIEDKLSEKGLDEEDNKKNVEILFYSEDEDDEAYLNNAIQMPWLIMPLK